MNSYLQAHDDCINSVGFINWGQQQEFLVTSSGQRNFIIPTMDFENESSDSSLSEIEEYKKQEINMEKKNSIKFWKFENKT